MGCSPRPVVMSTRGLRRWNEGLAGQTPLMLERRWAAESRINAVRHGENTVSRRICQPTTIPSSSMRSMQIYPKRQGGDIIEKLAPLGYEDATGFHFGAGMTAYWRSPDVLFWGWTLHDARSNCDNAPGSVHWQNIPPMRGHGCSQLGEEAERLGINCGFSQRTRSRTVFHPTRRRSVHYRRAWMVCFSHCRQVFLEGGEKRTIRGLEVNRTSHACSDGLNTTRLAR